MQGLVKDISAARRRRTGRVDIACRCCIQWPGVIRVMGPSGRVELHWALRSRSAATIVIAGGEQVTFEDDRCVRVNGRFSEASQFASFAF